MKDRAAVIILKDNQILLLYRIKQGREYYAIPGGTIESGETPEQAAVRELKEEATIDVTINKLLWEIENLDRKEYFYLAKDFTGEPVLSGPEAEHRNQNNFYLLEWIPFDNLEKIDLLPPIIKTNIINYLKK